MTPGVIGQRSSVIAVVVLAACSSFGGVRPRYGAMPQSVRLVTARPAIEVIQLLEGAARAAGLDIARSAPREGYLETGWFDLDRRATVGPPFSRMDRVVKLRFFSDPEQGRTRLLAECVMRIAWDPSVPERELERMVPGDHPGRLLLDSLVAAVPASSGPPLP